MTAIPQVSIVMSVFNGAEYLRDSIKCILDQEGVDFEFIVVDDGSDGETPDILSECARRDPRVRVLRQERSGLTKALISGCEIARGAYIARQDNGDQSLPGRLLTQKQALDADEKLAFVSCWTEFCGPENEFLYYGNGSGIASAPTPIISKDSPNGLSDGPSCHPSVMMRRDAYLAAGGYRPQYYFGQDWDLWYRLAESGRFQMIERVLYRARVMPNSLSGRHKSAQEMIGTLSYQAMLRRQRGQSEDDLLQQAQAIRPTGAAQPSRLLKAKGLYFIGERLRRNGDERAEIYFRKAMAASPMFFKPWLRLGQIWLKAKL